VKDACECGARTANECLFNYVSSYLFIASNAPSPTSYFLFALPGRDEVASSDAAQAARAVRASKGLRREAICIRKFACPKLFWVSLLAWYSELLT
jgi:hypothetical protein